jgi:hypothetical protein
MAPTITAAVILIVIWFSSNYFSERGLNMVGMLSISVIGYILLMTVSLETQRGVAYFAVFLTTIGVCDDLLNVFTTSIFVHLPDTNLIFRHFDLLGS